MKIPNKFSLPERLTKLQALMPELRGPDRETDVEVAVALGLFGYEIRGSSVLLAERAEDGRLEWSAATPTEMKVPEFTGCLNAAYSLVMSLQPPHSVIMRPALRPGELYSASLQAGRAVVTGRGPTPAAALTAAAAAAAALTVVKK